MQKIKVTAARCVVAKKLPPFSSANVKAVKSINQENDGHEEEQIIGFRKQAEAGMPIKELCRQGGFSDATFYKWRAKFGGITSLARAACELKR